jgi:hypothetical protein
MVAADCDNRLVCCGLVPPTPRPAARWALLLAVGAAALAGCGQASRVAADATVRVSGTVVGADGRPLQDRPVRMGSGVSADDATLGVLTVGLACTSGICSGKVFDATTSGDGAYSFSLHGRDTQGSFGRARSELVSVSATPTAQQVSGAAASARFVVQTPTLVLPPLRLVDPGLTVAAQGQAVVARWKTDRPGPYTLSFETGSSPTPVWALTTGTSGATLDGRLLEGASGRAVLGGSTADRVTGSAVTLAWRSPGAAFASGVGAPASRGVPCVFGRPGRAERTEQCGLTDGDLAGTVTAPPVCDPAAAGAAQHCAPATTATVVLPAPVRADLVVVRGCRGGCAVQASADGVTFRPVGAAAGEFGTVRLDGGPVRAVRVGLGTAGLREVSVWAPAGTGDALRPVGPGTVASLRTPFAGPSTDEGHRLLLVVAGGLVLVMLVAVGRQLGRRRR